MYTSSFITNQEKKSFNKCINNLKDIKMMDQFLNIDSDKVYKIIYGVHFILVQEKQEDSQFIVYVNDLEVSFNTIFLTLQLMKRYDELMYCLNNQEMLRYCEIIFTALQHKGYKNNKEMHELGLACFIKQSVSETKSFLQAFLSVFGNQYLTNIVTEKGHLAYLASNTHKDFALLKVYHLNICCLNSINKQLTERELPGISFSKDFLHYTIGNRKVRYILDTKQENTINCHAIRKIEQFVSDVKKAEKTAA